jgi:hypothetical protein
MTTDLKDFPRQKIGKITAGDIESLVPDRIVEWRILWPLTPFDSFAD